MSKIKAARKAKGLTILEVATLIGVTPGTISRVERGLQGMRPETAKRLAAVLGLDPAEVIFADRVAPQAERERRKAERRTYVRRAADRGDAR